MLNKEQTFVNGVEVQPLIVLIDTDNATNKIEACRNEIKNKSFNYIDDIENIISKHTCTGLVMDLDEFIQDMNTFRLDKYIIYKSYHIL